MGSCSVPGAHRGSQCIYRRVHNHIVMVSPGIEELGDEGMAFVMQDVKLVGLNGLFWPLNP